MIACILTAGRGTRMGELGKNLNKALHPINGKAVISHIIEKFPPNTTFVIALGHLGQQVRNYLEIAHPELFFKFVNVMNYEGPGSGPGLSLLECKEYLEEPFYFVSCDTLWKEDIDWQGNENWVGVSPVPPEDTYKYCNFSIVDDLVIDLKDKISSECSANQAFIGLCHIKDYSIFWEGLRSGNLISGEHQVSDGISSLLAEKKIYAKQIDWTDVGDIEKYKKVVSMYENYDFSKQNEALYFINNRVIKFFVDENITRDRVKKAHLNPIVFPRVIEHKEQFYAYMYQNGETMYKVGNIENFSKLLVWLEKNLWKKISVSNEEMQAACQSFYREKTNQRIGMYEKKYKDLNNLNFINGENIPTAAELLSEIPWERLCDGASFFMHGDLQFDNILFDSESNDFILLDWRQDFAGQIEYGDIYYDFAKLYGGLLVNYDLIKLNLLSYVENADHITIDFACRYQSTRFIGALEEYIIERGYDLAKVSLIVGLIFLNMAPLHHYPFDKLLHALGRKVLNDEIFRLH
jgi:NDP-sugar pyrophosphorylase family protein